MSVAVVDIVQINIYGVTLAEMTQKGVDIPFLLGSFGIEKCVVFDVPQLHSLVESADELSTCSSDASSSYSDDSNTVKVEVEEEAQSIVALPAPSVPSLFNCSFSTIHSDDDGEILEDHGDEEIGNEVEGMEAESAEEQQSEASIIEYPTERVQTRRGDESTLFASHLFTDSVMDVMLDLLDEVENNAVAVQVAQRNHDNNEIVPATEVYAQELEYSGVAAPSSVPVQEIEEVNSRNTSSRLIRQSSNIIPVELDESLPSTLRKAMFCLDELMNDSIFRPSIQEFPSLHANPTSIDDSPASPKQKRVCLMNEAEHRDISNRTPNGQKSIINNNVNQIVVENEAMMEQNMEDNDNVNAYDDDYNDAPETVQVSQPVSPNFMDGVKINIRGGRKRPVMSNEPGKLRLLVGKKAITGDTRIVPCEHGNCNARLMLRVGYGRDRLINHVRTHMKGRTPWKCSLCTYASTTEANIRSHHKAKHSTIPWKAAVKDESPEDFQILLQTFKKCFPGCKICSR